MFCRQCEQTAQGTGCTVQGVCGKTSDTAVLQDLLIYALKGIAVYGNMARELAVRDREVDLFVKEGLFTTVTNVNFDPERLTQHLNRAYEIKEKIKRLFLQAYKKQHGKEFADKLPAPADWKPVDSTAGLVEQGKQVGVHAWPAKNEDARSLQELLLYGLKGMAAYADHASVLGLEDEEVNSYFYKALAKLAEDNLTVEELLAMNMEFGKVNFKCLELLDKANTGHFGNPVPTAVKLGVKKGPAIIVTGHDLLDLEQLLQQTEGKGINIYTHGEMLPAHGYPALNKYKHLAGHFGTAWQNQQKEFEGVPAMFLFTTNCIQKPRDSYKAQVFTTGLVAWPGIEHIPGFDKKDFSPAIKKALELGGFPQDNIQKEILVGFGHNAVLSVADKVIEAVKGKKIRHFFLIGGCDGAKFGRNYYTELAEKVPQDCVILTLACGKFRFNALEFGDIGGIPRLLDVGQCNDAYSAVKIALALADAFKCGVNDLPLSLVLSWYEQKAVCILITLLSLGVKNIRIGPSLPAFTSPNVVKVLVEQFGVKPITTPDADLKAILG
ncbi:MAG TPA: hydroxylamine reductase [Candidatus Omnitrophota bacterium]|nr:hydroxylamine reductase [Candidatus Omnitrophota bacterium]